MCVTHSAQMHDCMCVHALCTIACFAHFDEKCEMWHLRKCGVWTYPKKGSKTPPSAESTFFVKRRFLRLCGSFLHFFFPNTSLHSIKQARQGIKSQKKSPIYILFKYTPIPPQNTPNTPSTPVTNATCCTHTMCTTHNTQCARIQSSIGNARCVDMIVFAGP